MIAPAQSDSREIETFADRYAAQHAALRRQLDTLAARGQRQLFYHALATAARRALAQSPLALPVGPLIDVLFQCARRLAHLPPTTPDYVQFLALALAGPVAWLLVAVARAAARPRADRITALALYDRSFAPEDQLRTADEFLRSPELSTPTIEAAFMRAAVASVADRVRISLDASVPTPVHASIAVPRHAWWGAPVALALLLAHVFWPAPSAVFANGVEPVAQLDSSASAPRPPTAPPTEAAPDAFLKPTTAATDSASANAAPANVAFDAAPEKSSAAASATPATPSVAAGRSDGANSNTAQPSATAAAPAPTPPAAPRPIPATAQPLARPPTAAEKPAAPTSTHSDSGHGLARSPGSSAPTPGDQPGAPDRASAVSVCDVEGDSRDDDEVAEKTDPVSLPTPNEPPRDVDRQLANGAPQNDPPNDDARPNGRGGPGEPKKSRGVPSMILGIPVPDRITGTPSPGRIKISQELSSPSPQSAPPAEALPQQPRRGPIGPLPQTELPPWRRQLLEKFFDRARPAAPTRNFSQS